MAKLIDRCFDVVQKFSRLPNRKDEQDINAAIDMLGRQCNGFSFFPKVAESRFQGSHVGTFPEWLLDYMQNIDLAFSQMPTEGLVQVLNGYKAEYYRACAINFLSENRAVYRLTDECAEYINDINVSKVRVKDIHFPQSKFTINFRMDGVDFIIMVIRDSHGMRMTGINTVINTENEPSFASHTIQLSDDYDLRKLCNEEERQWNIHRELTNIAYNMLPSRGYSIVQKSMRAFVLKFMFLYNTRLFGKKQESELIKKVKISNYPDKIINGSHSIHYVSLTPAQSKHMREHREIMSALNNGTPRNWYVDMWPVGAYVRIVNGKTQHIESHWAHRKAGSITQRPEVVVTL